MGNKKYDIKKYKPEWVNDKTQIKVCEGLAKVCDLLAKKYKETPEIIKKKVKERCPECRRLRNVIKNVEALQFLKYAKYFRNFAKLYKNEQEVKNGKKH